MTAKKNRPLIPYLRQSRAKEVSISIPDQLAAVKRWAEVAGVKLAAPVVDEGVSGSKPWRERGLGAAVAACERGEASGIIVAWQDRLTREPLSAQHEVWEKLDAANARFVAVGDGVDTTLEGQQMLLGMKALVARDQWLRYRANWENARKDAIERGAKPGPCPAGYSRAQDGVLEPNGDAEAVVEAFRLRAEGGNWCDVARHLTGAGVVGSKGSSEWTPSAAQRLIANRNYLGEIKSGEYVNTGAHPALVSAGVFRRAARQSVRSGPVVRGDGPLLGGGLVRCGACGSALVRGVSRGYEHLRCSGMNGGVKHAAISLRILEPHLIGLALEQHTGWVYPELDSPDPGLEAAVRDAEEALREVEALQGTVRPAAYAVALSEAQDAAEAAQAALDAALPTPDGPTRWISTHPREELFFRAGDGDEAQDVLGEPLLDPDRLLPYDVRTARQFLRDMLGTVTVKPGRAAVQDRVTLG